MVESNIVLFKPSWMFLLRFRVYISNCIIVVLTMFQCLFPQWVLVLRYAL